MVKANVSGTWTLIGLNLGHMSLLSKLYLLYTQAPKKEKIILNIHICLKFKENKTTLCNIAMTTHVAS